MSDGLSEMDVMLAKLRSLRGMVERSAPRIAEALGEELKKNVAAGVGPDGKAWKETKDGRKPLQNVESALSTRAVGTVVIARLDGHYARHHLGSIRGSSKSNWLARPILPNTKVPKPVATAIHNVLTDEFKKATEGGR